LLAGLFACADAALTALSDTRLKALAQQAAPRFQRALERVSASRERVQSRYSVGRILALSIAVAAMFDYASRLDGTQTVWAALAGVLLITAVLPLAAMLGRRGADVVLPISALFFRPLEICMAPLALLPSLLGRVLPQLGGQSDARVIEAEVELLVDHGQRSGVLDEHPAEIIRNVFDFSDLTVRQIMVSRTKVIAVRLDTPIDDVLSLITETGHSRYPVYAGEIDDVVGLLYTKDLFRVVESALPPPSGEQLRARRDTLLQQVVRMPIQIVAESQGLTSVLQQMRTARQHMAVVVDEFGDMSGIVTLEDLLEEIVGDIQDESDNETAPIVELADGRVLVDGGVSMADLSAYLPTAVGPELQHDSLAGMITERLGHVPGEGTRLPAFGVEFIVRESDEKHVSKVEIVRSPAVS
jgi:CBS domain containing-hemolysin-like protein